MKINNHTQIPNEYIDSMYLFRPIETVVFLAICRKTIGWHKETDRISYSQLVKLTGLSINAIKSALKNLIKNGFINSELKENGYFYDLNFDNISVSPRDISPFDIACSDTGTNKTVSPRDTDNTKTISRGDTTKETININKDIDINTYIEYWNSSFSTNNLIPKITKITDKRIKLLKLRVNSGMDFKKCVDLISESDFLTGKSSSWAVTFDWLIKNDENFVKVLEGNYKNKFKPEHKKAGHVDKEFSTDF